MRNSRLKRTASAACARTTCGAMTSRPVPARRTSRRVGLQKFGDMDAPFGRSADPRMLARTVVRPSCARQQPNRSRRALLPLLVAHLQVCPAMASEAALHREVLQKVDWIAVALSERHHLRIA